MIRNWYRNPSGLLTPRKIGDYPHLHTKKSFARVGIGISLHTLSGSEGGAPPAWSPLDLTDLALFLPPDPAYHSLNGGDLAIWHDASSNGWDVPQGTPANQPLYNASDADFGGKPSVSFRSANVERLLATTGGQAGNFNHSIYVVARRDTAVNAFKGWVAYGRDNTSAASFIGESSGGAWWFGWSAGGAGSATAVAITPGTVYRAAKTYEAGTDLVNGWVDGAQVLTNASNGAPTFAASPGFLLGQRPSSTYSDVTIAAVVMKHGLFDATDRANLDAWAAAEFSL